MSNPSDPISPTPAPVPAPTPTPTPQGLIPAPAPTPTPISAPAPIDTITPFLGPLMALLRSKKGIVVLAALAFCLVVYFRDPTKFDKIMQFLAVTIPVWLGAQGYADGQKHVADATSANTGNGPVPPTP